MHTSNTPSSIRAGSVKNEEKKAPTLFFLSPHASFD
jgi:hypothetical protein